MKKIYMDYAATTPVDKRVLVAMKPYWKGNFANPSSIHSMGVKAHYALQKARADIADMLAAHERNIIFTASGTEANNLAIFGLAQQAMPSAHFITTEIEHSSLREPFEELLRRGFKVSILPVDADGLINPKDLRNLIGPETVLVSLGYANSEIGVIQPVKEIMKEIRHARKHLKKNRTDGPYLHLDASQALQYLTMNVEELGVDLMTMDAQKIYGPKGIGALYVRDGIPLSPLLYGGGQEHGMRSGTEPVSLIAGFAEAMKINRAVQGRECARLSALRDEFFQQLPRIFPSAIINGSRNHRLPNNINISIPGQDGEMIVLRLDERGIICSSAAACASGTGESLVVRAIATQPMTDKNTIASRAIGTLRFSLGRDTRRAHVTYLLRQLSQVCK